MTDHSTDRHAVDYGRPGTDLADLATTALAYITQLIADALGEITRLTAERDHARDVAALLEGEVERLRSGLRYIIELLGEDPDEHPHVSPIDLIAVKVAYLRGRDDALAEREAAEAGEE